MTYRTIRQPPLVDVIFTNSRLPKSGLVFRLPVEVEHLVQRTKILLRRTMAIQTPLHCQRRHARGEGHLVNRAVAGLATDPFGDVDAVVEVDEVRKLVQPLPVEGMPLLNASISGFKHGLIGVQLRMAGHACRERGDACEGRLLDRSMAVTAVETVITDVVLVAERHGLFERVIRSGGIRHDCAPHKNQREAISRTAMTHRRKKNRSCDEIAVPRDASQCGSTPLSPPVARRESRGKRSDVILLWLGPSTTRVIKLC